MRTAVSSGGNHPSKTTGESISMSSPVSSTGRTKRGSVCKWDVPQTRWDNIEYSVQVTFHDNESKRPHNHDSKERSISKNISWAVNSA